MSIEYITLSTFGPPVFFKTIAFINQVNSLIDEGVLTEAEGQPLIDAANSAIDQLSE